MMECSALVVLSLRMDIKWQAEIGGFMSTDPGTLLNSPAGNAGRIALAAAPTGRP